MLSQYRADVVDGGPTLVRCVVFDRKALNRQRIAFTSMYQCNNGFYIILWLRGLRKGSFPAHW